MSSSNTSALRRLALAGLQPLTHVLPKKIGRPVRRKIRDRMVLPDADVVFVSFPKSGRTWVRVMMSRVYHTHLGVPGDELFEFDNLHKLDPRIPRMLITHDGEPWHTPQGLQTDKSVYAGKKVILLARNPIDVAVSRYFHIRNRATWIPYPEYKDMPIGEFVWAPLGGLPTIVAYMNIWDRARATIRDLLMVRYEAFRTQPEATLAKVSEFLGLPATSQQIAEAVSYAAFENLRKKEELGAISSHRLGARQEGNPDSLKVRRGKVRGYLDYFSAEEVARLEAYVRDHLAPNYGYGQVANAGQSS
jgi:alcohol sulfotransferase